MLIVKMIVIIYEIIVDMFFVEMYCFWIVIKVVEFVVFSLVIFKGLRIKYV